jgi:hypothetical protein
MNKVVKCYILIFLIINPSIGSTDCTSISYQTAIFAAKTPYYEPRRSVSGRE